MTESVKLLIPLDGSPLAEHSLAYVSSLRSLGVTEVRLISVIDPITVPARREHEDEVRERNLLATYQATLAEQLRTETTLQVATDILDGPAPEAILEAARSYEPDYLIVTTHGASGLSRWRFGSVADKVIRGVDCPTLVVGPLAAERGAWLEGRLMPAFKSILLPLDGSVLAEQAIPEAERFVEAFGAKLHVVSVVSVGSVGLDAAWVGVSPRLEQQLTAEARQYLEQVAIKHQGLASASLEVRVGESAQVLTDYVRENAIDLVVMTTHGRGGFVRTALGSTTDRLLGGEAPVLVVRVPPE